MYRDFAYRIINSINQASLVTSHALASAALLTTPRHGVSIVEFKEVCRTFYDYLALWGVKFSNTLKNYDVGMTETLHDLERSKMVGKLKDEDDDLEEEVFTMEDSKRLTLEYYKNNIIHFLLPAAYVSTSILSQQTFRFSVSQVLEDVAFMQNFFKFEFVYDNQLSNEKLVTDVLDTFEKMDGSTLWEREINPISSLTGVSGRPIHSMASCGTISKGTGWCCARFAIFRKNRLPKRTSSRRCLPSARRHSTWN